MSSKIQFAIAAMTVLLAGAATQAQTRAGSTAATAARIAPTQAASLARVSSLSRSSGSSGGQASRQPNVIQISPSGHVISRTSSFADSLDLGDESGVPGLGFDYPHLAAVSGNFRNNPPGFGRGEHHRRGFITPVFFGGYPYISDSPDYQQEQPQPQIIVIQQPAPAVTVQLASPEAREPSSTGSVTPPAAPVPVREVGEFILVRRDGRVLFASVFSVTGTQLQYVTPEGIRRTLPLSDLDTDATQEMNEARGTTLQFHN